MFSYYFNMLISKINFKKKKIISMYFQKKKLWKTTANIIINATLNFLFIFTFQKRFWKNLNIFFLCFKLILKK